MVLEHFPEIMWHPFDLPPTYPPPPPPWDSRGPDRTLKLPQQTALSQFQHPSVSSTRRTPPTALDTHVFAAFNSCDGRNSERSLTSQALHVLQCACVCFTSTRALSHTHTHHVRRRSERWPPQGKEMAHASQTAANSSRLPQCHNHTQHWLFLKPVVNVFLVFWFINISFNIFFRLPFRPVKISRASFREGRWHLYMHAHSMRKDKFRLKRQDNDCIKHLFCFGANRRYVDDVCRSSAIEWNAKDN